MMKTGFTETGSHDPYAGCQFNLNLTMLNLFIMVFLLHDVIMLFYFEHRHTMLQMSIFCLLCHLNLKILARKNANDI